MTPGYYWAKHKQRGWIVVEVVAGLHGAVLFRGCAVQRSEFSEWQGPLQPPTDGQEWQLIPGKAGRI